MNQFFPKVLLVDDDELIQLAIRSMFRETPLDLVIAGSAEEALTLIKKLHFHLILLDVCLPNQTGLEFAESLAEVLDDESNIPIIFMTGTAHDQHSMIRGYKAGAVDYLKKPFDSDVLFRKVESVLGYQKQIAYLKDSLKQQINVEKELMSDTLKEEYLQLFFEEKER